MLKEVKAGCFYKLLDKEAYLESALDNQMCMDECFNGDTVLIDSVIIGEGYNGKHMIIAEDEFHLFEKVDFKITDFTVETKDCENLIGGDILDKLEKDLGVKYDGGKLDWSLLPVESVEQVLEVLMFGAEKYAPDNWKHVDNAQTRYYNAALRHITAWKKGKKLDPETGKSHIAHATCCLLFLLHFEESEKLEEIFEPAYTYENGKVTCNGVDITDMLNCNSINTNKVEK